MFLETITADRRLKIITVTEITSGGRGYSFTLVWQKSCCFVFVAKNMFLE
jgi:hypothetical protein